MTLWERRRDKNAHKLCHKIASLECLGVPVTESRKVMFRYSYRWSYILPNISVEILASVLQNRTVLGERAIGKGQRVNVIGVLICMIQISHFTYIIHIWIIYIYIPPQGSEIITKRGAERLQKPDIGVTGSKLSSVHDGTTELANSWYLYQDLHKIKTVGILAQTEEELPPLTQELWTTDGFLVFFRDMPPGMLNAAQ